MRTTTTELMHGLAFRCLASAWSLPRPLIPEGISISNRLIDVGDSATLRALVPEPRPVARRRRTRAEIRMHWLERFTRLGRARVAPAISIDNRTGMSPAAIDLVHRLGAECDLRGWEFLRAGVGRPTTSGVARLRVERRTAARRAQGMRLIAIGDACIRWLKINAPEPDVGPARMNAHPNVPKRGEVT